MDSQNEEISTGSQNLIRYECTKTILNQMEKCICKIEIDSKQGTGFFCQIPFPEAKEYDMLPIFITSSNLINRKFQEEEKNKISFDIKKDKPIKSIYLKKRKKYINEEYGITIIEIKEQDNIKNYLKLDDVILNNILNKKNNINYKRYVNKPIYTIQYPKGDLSLSYGILDNINEFEQYNFTHKCITKEGSSGSPILTMDNKLIGIHNEKINDNPNQGTFLYHALKEFIEKYSDYYLTHDKFYKKDNEIVKILRRSHNILRHFNIRHYGSYNPYKEFINSIELNGSGLWIFNEHLNDMSKIKFDRLKKLYLGLNNISNIAPLENIIFNQLEVLDLSKNRITDISKLENAKFNELKELYLSSNNISDLKVLEKVKFEKLEILDLSDNKITDIDILERVKFKELLELYLNNNTINDLKVFTKIKFEKLEILDLNKNKIDEKENDSIISKLKDEIEDLRI